jgi:hypothetical protein
MSSEEASQKLEHSNIPIKRPRKKKVECEHDWKEIKDYSLPMVMKIYFRCTKCGKSTLPNILAESNEVQKPYENSPKIGSVCNLCNLPLAMCICLEKAVNKRSGYMIETPINRDHNGKAYMLKILLYVPLGLGLIVFHVVRTGIVAESAYMTGFQAGYDSTKTH